MTSEMIGCRILTVPRGVATLRVSAVLTLKSREEWTP
jgi:hypothetical protein